MSAAHDEAELPSTGTLALLLIRLGARCGQMVPVSELASTYRLPAARVRAALRELADQGHVRVTVGDDGRIMSAQSAVERV